MQIKTTAQDDAGFSSDPRLHNTHATPRFLGVRVRPCETIAERIAIDRLTSSPPIEIADLTVRNSSNLQRAGQSVGLQPDSIGIL